MIQIGKVRREALAILRILSIRCISLSRLLRGLLSRLLGILLLVGLLVLSRKVSEFLAELLILLRELKSLRKPDGRGTSGSSRVLPPSYHDCGSPHGQRRRGRPCPS